MGSEEETMTANNDNNTNDGKKKGSPYKPKFGCFMSGSSDEDYPVLVEESNGDGSFDVKASFCAKEARSPQTHLIIMVNGIMGSAQNWKFGAKQFLKKYPEDVIVHCSECNTTVLTFDGVDVMGRRLADEVISVAKRYPNLKKISFVCHSLGGLIARYAIAVLYQEEEGNKKNICQESVETGVDGSEVVLPSEENFKGKIAALEPVNFITFATPHLGCRGHKQVPVFGGFYPMEKAASHLSWFLGKTGRHLFLTDKEKGKSPLLLQMVNDCEDLKFMSSLKAFRRRVVYANARYDYIVGWSTSSLRRRSELPKLKRLSRNDRYPHIVNMETAKAASGSQEEEVSSTAKAKLSKTDEMEEAMLRPLTKMNWERVDVNFKGSRQRYLAHITIQVKSYFINSDGADVVHHMVDKFSL